jgi:hypothetical protein
VTESIERTLGRIEATLEALCEKLDAHTAQDAANFAELRAQIAEVKKPTTLRERATAWGAGVGAAGTAAYWLVTQVL